GFLNFDQDVAGVGVVTDGGDVDVAHQAQVLDAVGGVLELARVVKLSGRDAHLAEEDLVLHLVVAADADAADVEGLALADVVDDADDAGFLAEDFFVLDLEIILRFLFILLGWQIDEAVRAVRADNGTDVAPHPIEVVVSSFEQAQILAQLGLADGGVPLEADLVDLV